jgi:NAD+ synthase (glutamine-hydrolysing)
VAFCALVGGQDELVFDGHSCVLDHTGALIARAAQFEEELLLCELDLQAAAAARLRDSGHRSAARRIKAPAEVLPPLDREARAAPGAGARTAATAAVEGEAGGAPGAGARTAATAAAVEAEAADSAGAETETGAIATPTRAALRALLEPREAEVYAALSLGLRDYVEKNRFAHVVLGIDSALVACLAADALGAERVSVAVMPSRYSSAATQDDARALAAALGVGICELAIEAAMDAYVATLHDAFAGREPDVTEENLQARIRGNLLMALSNKFGWLVLTTGNKSEMSVGYTTLYGDLAGGFAVIKDVPKTLVYRLCEWRNSEAGHVGHRALARAPIPATIIERAPSAELRADQRDEDSLPPYELLDRILLGYVELDRGRDELLAEGLPAQDVDRVIRLVDLAEYKRRQAPPGIKITTRAFGRDRRMPITNRYGR